MQIDDDTVSWDELDKRVSPYFTLDQEKSCIGKRIFVYHLSKAIEADFFDDLVFAGELTFPLGESYSFFQFTCPGQFVMTGLFKGNELKVAPRFKASLPEVRQKVEAAFNLYGQKE